MRKDGEKLAANIIKAAESPYLTKMKLMKLAFIVEYEAVKQLGHRLSQVPFETARLGVVCWDVVNNARSSEMIQGRSALGWYGLETRVSLRSNTEPRPYEPEEQELLERVVKEHHSKYNADGLGEKTKKIVGYDPWSENLGCEIDMDVVVLENEPEFRARLERLSRHLPEDYEEAIPVEEFLAGIENH